MAKDSRIIDSMIHADTTVRKSPWWLSYRRVSTKKQHSLGEAPDRSRRARYLLCAGLKIHAKLFLISRKENGEVGVTHTSGPGTLTKKPRVFILLFVADRRCAHNQRSTAGVQLIENPYRPVTFDYLMVSPQNSAACCMKWWTAKSPTRSKGCQRYHPEAK